jgi:tetratricopeptide (TPR) repeat protein
VTTYERNIPVKKHLLALILALSPFSGLLPGLALAADTAPAPQAKPQDPALEQARAAIQKKDWPAAQSILRDAVARDSSNADYNNLYAYSIRKGANPDMSLVFKHYNQALSIDPRHKGAHEYLGEAYLMVGNVGKAKEHLQQLDQICFFPCREFSELKTAISEFETKQVAR